MGNGIYFGFPRVGSKAARLASTAGVWALLLFQGLDSARAERPAPPARTHIADYDAELRGANGRVDVDALVARLRELGVTTYYWLVWHAPTDWDDLKLFLPKARAAGIEVWAYLAPPSESPPHTRLYSEPFRLDYPRWAEEIARLSLAHTNLTAWVIDDFASNVALFTPAYVRAMRARAQRINPQLAFLPLMYFNEMRQSFVEDYRAVIDGVVVAYLQDREEIEQTWALLNDAGIPQPGEFSYPRHTPSRAGDFALADQPVKILPAARHTVHFCERDDFSGPTAGFHCKQLLVDGAVVWEQDVAGGSLKWQPVAVDVTEQVRNKTRATMAFRLMDKRGVSNFGVSWDLKDLRADGIELAADFNQPQKWQVHRQGAFETGFEAAMKSGRHRFHVPFIFMTAASAGEFRMRHGDPASPARIADQFRLSLQALRDGRCDGVVTYCLDKRPASMTFSSIQKLIEEFKMTPRTLAGGR